MNRILFTAEEIQASGTVLLYDARATHIRDVLHASVGDVIRTGTVNGAIGTSCIVRMANDGVWLSPCHTETAPEPWIDLILAVPRPKVLRRLWPQLAALGVGKIVILSAFKTERFYFSTQWLDPMFYKPLLIDGLMQAGVSHLPQVHIRKWFQSYVEKELDTMFPNSLRLLAHPSEECSAIPSTLEWRRPVLAVGPEGGWVDSEIEMLTARGFTQFSLGERVLRSDTATIALISALMVSMAQL
ncbi:MAG: 16S rRNA (uracil(1498)-N(3))-methyltransferase [Kiritimatiellaeota bacterium]|nr:16S rRNA (uracil(1498)-N(3))-methyltransferase [Kiritimatiellota bacterium]